MVFIEAEDYDKMLKSWKGKEGVLIGKEITSKKYRGKEEHGKKIIEKLPEGTIIPNNIDEVKVGANPTPFPLLYQFGDDYDEQLPNLEWAWGHHPYESDDYKWGGGEGSSWYDILLLVKYFRDAGLRTRYIKGVRWEEEKMFMSARRMLLFENCILKPLHEDVYQAGKTINHSYYAGWSEADSFYEFKHSIIDGEMGNYPFELWSDDDHEYVLTEMDLFKPNGLLEQSGLFNLLGYYWIYDTSITEAKKLIYRFWDTKYTGEQLNGKPYKRMKALKKWSREELKDKENEEKWRIIENYDYLHLCDATNDWIYDNPDWWEDYASIPEVIVDSDDEDYDIDDGVSYVIDEEEAERLEEFGRAPALPPEEQPAEEEPEIERHEGEVWKEKNRRGVMKTWIMRRKKARSGRYYLSKEEIFSIYNSSGEESSDEEYDSLAEQALANKKYMAED